MENRNSDSIPADSISSPQLVEYPTNDGQHRLHEDNGQSAGPAQLGISPTSGTAWFTQMTDMGQEEHRV